ncbi:MAG TPA: hypothetical protein VFG71_09195 [Nitrospiraceae bacterium]|nr:hypothetical protein [Nitrospiraceae bacterium]
MRFEEPVDRARRLYYEGIAGNKEALAESDRLFTALHRTTPVSSLVRAYYGSHRLLAAAKAWAPWEKYALSKEGLTELDAAVTNASHETEVRFVRAMTTYHLPFFFGRREQSAEDFALLAEQVPQAAHAGKLAPSLAAAALYHYGLLRKESSDFSRARDAWEQAVTLAPNSIAGRDAAKRLQAIELERHP